MWDEYTAWPPTTTTTMVTVTGMSTGPQDSQSALYLCCWKEVPFHKVVDSHTPSQDWG